MMPFTPQRAVLGELSSIPFTVGAADANSEFIPESFLTPSPEEQIIRQRSLVRSSGIQFDGAEKEDTPSRSAFDSLPSSRKRLVLTAPCSRPPSLRGTSRSLVSKVKRCRVKRCRSFSVPLSTQLKGYTSIQLAHIIDRLVSAHPQLEQEVRRSLPLPDIQPLEERLDYLHHNVLRAIPSIRWCSSRDAFTYHRVKGHIDVFRKVCIEQGRILVNAQCWEAVFRYVLASWRHVYHLPTWDEPTHNESKTSCFRHLAAQCMVALKSCSSDQQTLKNLRQRLMVAAQISTEIEPCLNFIDRVLSEKS